MVTTKKIDYSVLKKNLDEFYTPQEIADRNWIVDRNRNGNYSLVLKLIRIGRLTAMNYSVGVKPMYKVKASEIIKYLESQGIKV